MNAQLNAERVNDSAAQPKGQPRVQARPLEKPALPWPEQPAPASSQVTAARNQITFFDAPDATGVSEVTSIASLTGDTTASLATSTTSVTSVTIAPEPVQRTSSDNNPDQLPPLVHAAQRGDLAEVKALLAASNADIRQFVAKHGASALSFAAGEGHCAIVGALIAAGADPNRCALDDGDSALMLAAAMGHRDVVELLVKVPNIDLDRINEDGDNALILAARNIQPGIVGCLLNAGAEVNVASIKNSQTALLCAVDQRELPMVQLLLQRVDIDIDYAPHGGSNALALAAYDNDVDMVNCLIRAGANVNYISPSNREDLTPLMWATINDSIEAAGALLAHDEIKVDIVNGKGKTALYMAASCGVSTAMIDRLLAAGAQLNVAHPRNGSTPLMAATQAGWADIVQHLLGVPGIDIEARCADSNTALFYAIFMNHPEVVAALVDANANLEQISGQNRNALQEAICHKRAAVMEVLLERGIMHPDIASLVSASNPALMAIVDLHADREGKVADLPAQAQAMAFFNHLASCIQDGDTMPLLRRLHGRGMRLAAAQEIAALLAATSAAWPAIADSEKSPAARQALIHFACALSRLNTSSLRERLQTLYFASGISPEAVKRLSGVAADQLAALAAMAEIAAAQLGDEMFNALIPVCLARTGLEHEIDSTAFARSLADDGFFAPIAQIIAFAWKAAIAALQGKNSTIPAGLTVAQAKQVLRAQTERHAPGQLALSLQDQLATRDSVHMLQAMLGRGDDENLHALFQVQHDQLRQFCEQLLAQETAQAD